MINAITDYIDNKSTGLVSLEKASKTVTIFKKQFDENTGVEKPYRLQRSFAMQEIKDKIAELQAQITKLEKFAADEELDALLVEPDKPVEELVEEPIGI